MCKKFAKGVQTEFEMYLFGKVNFFLGLPINQVDNGIFISYSKYVKEVLKNFGMEDSKMVCTPMVIGCKLSKDDKSSKVDQTKYKYIIGGFLYLTATRLDIMHEAFLVATF
jgi:hypothetical protein